MKPGPNTHSSDITPTLSLEPVRLTAERERRRVIISKHGKSYDTSNGSEQSFEEAPPPSPAASQAARPRWEDDGGHPQDPSFKIVGELPRKPAWSVLSLADLNEAIRRENRVDHPAKVRQELERERRRLAQAIQAHEDRVAAAAEAEHDRYRNDWEHR